MSLKAYSSVAQDSDTVLKRVSELFKTPKNWTQRALARDEKGFRLDIHIDEQGFKSIDINPSSERKVARSDKACSVCTMAGVYRANGAVKAETVAVRRLALAIVNKYGKRAWNADGRWTVDRVMSSTKGDLISMIIKFNDSSSTSFKHVQKAVAAARGVA